jgi:hypothetical protein
MQHSRLVAMLTGLVALSGVCVAAQTAPQTSAPQVQTPAGPAAAPAQAGPPKLCLAVESSDTLIREFSDRLKDAIAASHALSLASTTDACNLQLHVPGNLLRFETAGGVMVSTVVIVTSSSGRYLSTSISACRADDLKPCATRAVAAAKLALLVRSNEGT